MIVQRDLANPQHLLAARPPQMLGRFNSLTRATRSNSYLSIAHKPDPQPTLPKQMPRQRHSMHSSQSQLMPEYHQNPYLATMDTSPQKRPLLGHFATLRRGHRDNQGMGVEAVLSQPEPSASYGDGSRVGYAQGPADKIEEEEGQYPESLSQQMSYYGSAIVQNTSRRKLHKKKSPPRDDGAGLTVSEVGILGALSQPTEGFTELPGSRGGGSMRHPAPVRPPPGKPPPGRPMGGMFGMRGSLTQQDEEHTSLGRASSMNPRRPAPARPAPKATPSIVVSRVVPEEAAKEGMQQQATADQEEGSVEWTVSGSNCSAAVTAQCS
jgi:hypothetical protein